MNFIDENKLESYIGGFHEHPMTIDCKQIGENTFRKTLMLEIEVPKSSFGPNFRTILADSYKKKYENKVLYLFYIIKVDTSPLLDKVLPIIPSNTFIIKNNLDVDLYTVQKETIVELSIIVYSHNNKLYIKGQNKYINCNIIASSDYKIIKKINKYEIVFDNGNIIGERDNTPIKITDVFSSNDCQTDYLICEGEFI